MTSLVRGISIASAILACSKTHVQNTPDAETPIAVEAAAPIASTSIAVSADSRTETPPSPKPELTATTSLCRPTKSHHNLNTSGACMWTVVLEGDLKTCTWEKDRRGKPELCKRLCGHDEEHCTSITANVVSCGVCKGREGGAP